MKKHYLFLFSIVLLFSSAGVRAQLVGSNAFLQGAYLEIGELPNGSFGTNSSPTVPTVPTVYHPHSFGTTWTPGGALAEVYDWGHDGWSVGAPNFMGDYTYPGSPFEGWELQIGTGRNQAFQASGAGYAAGSGGCGLAGSVVSYSNVGGRAISNWTGSAGTAAALQITQETRVDTFASSVVVTTKMKNVSGGVVPQVYYMRSCDPDNDESWTGGGFPTNNTIVHQNEDATHKVMVKAIGMGYPASAYLALATKDCRAKCFIYDSWSLSSGVDLSTTWNGTYSGATYNLGGTRNGDIAIGLTYNIGDIPAGDSALISYSYVFNGDLGIDSSFPDPQIVINGTPHTSWAPPQPNYDTFNVCLYPGMTSLPVNILHANDKDWSWSTWTWAPSIGLTSTTGTSQVINTTALPPIITFTITGSDSASGMSSCLRKTFYLTILTCNGALCNSPCENDTLWFNAPGDSTGATYQWYGPAPSTTVFGTNQHQFIYPATMANNGTYTVIKTVGSVHDTSYCTATIHPKPYVTAGSNAPLCLGAANTLSLTATTAVAGVTYNWTAPTTPPYSSTLQNPVINPFAVGDTGWYQVVVTSLFGCKDTDQTHVTMLPPPAPPVVTAHTPYCQFDAFIPFTITGLQPGGSTLWYTSATGGTGSATTPVINTSAIGTTKLWFSQIVGSCEGLRDSITIVVNPVPAPITGTMGVCQYFTTLMSDVTTGGTWSSSAPGIGTIDAGGLVSGLTGGITTVTYTISSTGCYRTTDVTIYPKPAPPVPGLPNRICQFKLAVPLVATGSNLTWYGTGVTPGTPIAPTPETSTPGTVNYYLTQTSAFGCVSDSATFPFTVVPEPAPPVTADTSYCQQTNAPALTAIGSNLLWYTSATSTTGVATAPVPSTVNPGTTTFYVSQTVNQCESHMSPLNVTVLYLPQFTIDAKPWVCQFDSIMLSYHGPSLVQGMYSWDLPFGASFAGGSAEHDTTVWVKFDTAWGTHDVILTASDYNGRCATSSKVQVKVVPAPDASAYINSNVCLGDTVTLALSYVSSGAANFTWSIDGTSLNSTRAIRMISSSANSGGPFLISWSDSGRHIIVVNGFTEEGCKAIPTNDTVDVHVLPDATFKIVTVSTKLCQEDSVQFVANSHDYTCSYKWEPEHFFSNENKPVIWGRVEQSNSVIKLTVTDPFGCKSIFTQQVNPDACCTVWFPNAFTPEQGHNKVFRPVFAGYHRFHEFRVSNRWGQTIFQSANSNPEWNGTYNEVPQDLGTYYYYIKYDCGGKTIEQKGDVTLVR
jgi:gliding motility-associated-like protein